MFKQIVLMFVIAMLALAFADPEPSGILGAGIAPIGIAAGIGPIAAAPIAGIGLGHGAILG
ncbi:hypothetical protein HHI36_005318 [Cryptolaemus montrouzieri]|uniref:Uncharacterized protein n=1 Tax=Cryptolaemus montrouzieri TaxID=559131 RepID=A0ABD2NTZ2_9CUCU